ncbi:MAG: cytochrome c oxidase subunit II [Acidobacteria bacterium]|nr:cytochrome c oxidase subunit II [Acidobacteriota bacterium]
MAFLLGLVIAIITLATMYGFAFKVWWFPAFISEYGAAYDHQFQITLIVCGIVFFLAQLGLAYAVWRYRDRGGRGSYSHGNNVMEATWTIATAIVFLGVALMGQKIWARVHLDAAPANALQVEVTGQQFAWNVRYPGPDGKFGRTKPELMKESLGNPLGVDPDDPASKDDVVMPVMAVPVNRPVEVLLRSKDVIHSFYVRELRLKQDAVPGMENRLHFTASQTGRFEIPCAELCGLGHHQMRSFLLVMSEEDYANWLKENAPQAQ